MATSKIAVHANHLGLSPGVLIKYENGDLDDQEMKRINKLVKRYKAAKIKTPCDSGLLAMQKQLNLNQAELAMLFGLGLTAVKDGVKGVPVSRERRAIVRAHLNNIPILDALLIEEKHDMQELE